MCFYQDLGYIFIIFCQTTDLLLPGHRPQTKDAFTSSKLLLGKFSGSIFLLFGLFAQTCSFICYNDKGLIFFFFSLSAENDCRHCMSTQWRVKSVLFSWVFLLINCYLAFWRPMPFCCCLLFLYVKLNKRTFYQNHVSSMKATLTKHVHVMCWMCANIHSNWATNCEDRDQTMWW